MTLRYTTLAISVILMCGCGALKTTQTTPQNHVEDVVLPQEPLILYPQSNNHTEKVQPKQVTQKPQPPKETIPSKVVAPPKPIAVPKMRFSAVESANVRVPNVNPLPSKGLSLPFADIENDFCYPYKGKVISNYGYRGRRMHTGVDIKAVPNDTIRAAMPGVVRMAKYYSGYGNIIVVQHYCGIETVYGHNAKNLVQPNDPVLAGQAIALAGRTGRATTEHLHFEVRVAGEHIDPNKLLDCQNWSLRRGELNLAYRGGRVMATNGPETGNTEQSEDYAPERTQIPATRLTPAIGSTQAKADTPKGAAYHRVVKGDTLSKIARDYSTTVAQLCQLNNIAKTHILSLGLRLKVR